MSERRDPRLPGWRLGLGLLFIGAACWLTLLPPPSAPPSPSFADAGLLERLFPSVPGDWVIRRLLCILAAALCLAGRGAANLFATPPLPAVPPAVVAVDARRLHAALICAAVHVAAFPTLWFLNQPLQLLYIAWLAVPTLILLDGQRIASWWQQRWRPLLLLSSLAVVWLGLRLGPSWRSPRIADLVDDWRAMRLLELAFEPTFNLLIDRTMSGAGTSFHFIIQGAGWGQWLGFGPSFAAVQIAQFAGLAVAGVVIGWIALKLFGTAAAAVATTSFLFSPFALMLLLTPLPAQYGPLMSGGLMLLLLSVRFHGSVTALTAFGALAGVAMTWHGSVLIAAMLTPVTVWTAWYDWRLPRKALLVALGSFTAAMASAIPDLIDIPNLVTGYAHSRAQWVGHEMAGYGQVSRLTSQYLVEAATVFPFDIPLSALLSPLATPRTPMRLAGDTLFDGLSTCFFACGLLFSLLASRRSWAARLMIAALILGLLPLSFASTDRISLNRFLGATVPVSLLAGAGFEMLRRYLGRASTAGAIGQKLIPPVVVAAVAAGGIALFDHVNPRLLYSSWGTVAFAAMGNDGETHRAVLFDHPKPTTFPYGYLPDLVRAVAPERAQVVVFEPGGEADPLAQHDGTEAYLWNPALEEDEAVSQVLCARWPDASLFVIYDVARQSRAFAATPPGSTWQPHGPPAQWSRVACGTPLPTETIWASTILAEAERIRTNGDTTATAELLRNAARHTFAHAPLFVATAEALRASTDPADRREAWFWADRAVRATRSREPRSVLLLSALQAELDTPGAAITTLETARQQIKKLGDPAALAELDRALQSYRARKPALPSAPIGPDKHR